MQLELSREVDAPAERVWAVITDIDGWADTLSAITRIERLDDGAGFGPGFRWRETRVMFGNEATEEMQVSAVDEGRSYDVVAESHGTRYHSVLAVEPLGEARARLSMRFVAHPQTLTAKLLGSTLGLLFRGPTRRALQQDLDDIATRAVRSTT